MYCARETLYMQRVDWSRCSILVNSGQAERSCKVLRVGRDFDPVDSIHDPGMLTIICVVLWIFRNRGNHAEVTTTDVDSVKLSIYNHAEDKNRCSIFKEEFDVAASDIKWHFDTQKLTTSQVVAYIQENWVFAKPDGFSAYRNELDRDAILVAKKKAGFALCSVPSSVKAPTILTVSSTSWLWASECEYSCNVLVLNGDGVWDNHGGTLWSYISRAWNICKRRICVRTIH